jgi:hypothetical protein
MKLNELTAETVKEITDRFTVGTMLDKETMERKAFTAEELADMIIKAANEGFYQIGGHKFNVSLSTQELLEGNGFKVHTLYSPDNLAVDDGIVISWE